MSSISPYDFTKHLKDDERLLWTGTGSGRNASFSVLAPMISVALLGLVMMIGYPLSGFEREMALVALWGMIVSAIVVWFYRTRLNAPSREEYAVTTQRILIVSGPIRRVCRPYSPTQKKRTTKQTPSFYGVKHLKQRKTIVFLTAGTAPATLGFPPVFVGVEDSLRVARLAAETYELKLVER